MTIIPVDSIRLDIHTTKKGTYDVEIIKCDREKCTQDMIDYLLDTTFENIIEYSRKHGYIK